MLLQPPRRRGVVRPPATVRTLRAPRHKCKAEKEADEDDGGREIGKQTGRREGRGGGAQASEPAAVAPLDGGGSERASKRASKSSECSLSLSPPSLPSPKQAGSAHNHHPSVPLRRVRRTPEKDKRKNDLFWKTLIKQLSTWYLSHLLLRDHQYFVHQTHVETRCH